MGDAGCAEIFGGTGAESTEVLGMTRHLQRIFPQEITLGKGLHVHLYITFL